MPKYRTKKALYHIFDYECLIYLGIFGQEFKKQLLSYLKLAPSRVFDYTVFQKSSKISKFVSKNALLGHFWARMPYLGILLQKSLKKLL